MAHQPFTGNLPDDRLYCPECDTWVQALANDWQTLTY